MLLLMIVIINDGGSGRKRDEGDEEVEAVGQVGSDQDFAPLWRLNVMESLEACEV